MTIDDRAAKRAAETTRKAAILESAKINRGLEEILSSREGRTFLWWLLGEAGFGQQPHTANALNTAFNCGKLEVANYLLARIALVDPAGFVRMQAERIENVNSGNDDTASAGTIARDDDAELGEWERDEAG